MLRKPIRKRNNKLAIIDGIWKAVMDKRSRDFSIQVEIHHLKSRFFLCRDVSIQVDIFHQGEGRDVTQDSLLAFPAKDKNNETTWRSVVL